MSDFLNKTGWSWFLLGCWLICSAQLPRQPKAKLLRDRARVEQKIGETADLLAQARSQSQSALRERQLLDQQIELREERIALIQQEVEQFYDDMADLDEISCQLAHDIEQIRASYTQTARLSYQRLDSDSFWLAIFAAEGLSEAYYRALYFRQFSQYRKRQLEVIQKSVNLLDSQLQQLADAAYITQKLLESKEEERQRLARTRAYKQRLYEQASQEVRSRSQDLQHQEQEYSELKDALETYYKVK